MDATPKPSKRNKKTADNQRTTVSVSLYASPTYVQAVRRVVMRQEKTFGKWLYDLIEREIGDEIKAEIAFFGAPNVQSNDHPRIKVSNS